VSVGNLGIVKRAPNGDCRFDNGASALFFLALRGNIRVVALGPNGATPPGLGGFF